MPDRKKLFDRDVWSLFDVSWASESGGLEAYLHSLLKRCATWFDASSASIFLRQESGEFLLAAKTGRGRRMPGGTRVRSGEGIAGASIESGEPLLVTDPEENAMLAGKVDTRRDLGSSMIIPLLTPESGCVGVVNLARRKGIRPFTVRDLRHAKSFGRHLALGVSNARLFGRMNVATSRARAMHEKLGAVINCLGVGVIVVNRFGEVTECNPEAVAFVGHQPAHQASWFEVVEAAPKSVARPMEAVLAGALSGLASRRRAFDAETESAWSLTGTPLPDGGATLAVQDVTAHERSQRDLARVNRLAEIGQMTAAIAHEIRNPLTGIRSAAQLVRDNPEDAQEFVQIIEDEAMKLNGLCDEFLEFARPLTLHPKEVRVGEIVRTVADRHQAEFDAARVSLEVQIAETEPIIRADPVRVEQICRNLVLNALQACRHGGTVRIQVDEEGFWVLDDGAGMEEATLARLFTPFFTTKPNGTGLGLSNVRKIVDAHGGTIEVASQAGKGTSFRVRLALRKIA